MTNTNKHTYVEKESEMKKDTHTHTYHENAAEFASSKHNLEKYSTATP